MKKLTAVALTVLLWYLGGMYQNHTLMAFSICAAVVVVILLITSILMCRNVSLSIPNQVRTAYKHTEKAVSIRAVNKGILPVSKMGIVLKINYTGNNKKFRKRFYGNISGKKISRSASPEQNDMEFYFTSPYCGPVDISLKRLTVYDWLSIFAFSKFMNQKETFCVMPFNRNIQIAMPPVGDYTGDPVTLSNSDKKGNDFSEIRQIREYRSGDLYRHIHQNYTARTGILWVKDYMKENDFIFDFVLDTCDSGEPSIEHSDAFFDISYNIISALIQNEAIVILHWFNKDTNHIETHCIAAAEQLDRVFQKFIMTNTKCTPDDISVIYSTISPNKMVFNTNLEWYFAESAVYRFDENDFENELINHIFTLQMRGEHH